MMSWLLIPVALLLTGCMNIAASLQPEDASVPVVREVSDCVPIILGFSYGTATLEEALAEEVRPINEKFKSVESKKPRIQDLSVPQKITKIRRVLLHDYQFLMFGARCVEVVGE